jgi:hypothetical protein
MQTFSEISIVPPPGFQPAGSILADLLSTEIAGRVTYGLVADRVELLRQVETEHRAAADALRGCLRENGLEEPAESASLGLWSAAARAAVADELVPILIALRQAEKAVYKTYEASIERLDPASAQVVQNKLIPAQSRRVRLISQLLTGIAGTHAAASPA